MQYLITLILLPKTQEWNKSHIGLSLSWKDKLELFLTNRGPYGMGLAQKDYILGNFFQKIGWNNPKTYEIVNLRLTKVELRMKYLATRLDYLFLYHIQTKPSGGRRERATPRPWGGKSV